MRDLYINAFYSQRDNRVKPGVTSWENIVTLFTSGHEVKLRKEDATLFNCAHYKAVSEIPEYSDDWVQDAETGSTYAKRRQINLIENDLLVLDYDGGVTLEAIEQQFQAYEYVYYTSYRHLHDGETEKFRFILPLKNPIPTWKRFNEHGVAVEGGDWYQILDALKTFAGSCDPKSFDPNQMYLMPSAPTTRIPLSRSGHNTGDWLDWERFDRIPFKKLEEEGATTFGDSLVPTSTDHLLPDQILSTEKGQIKVSDVEGRIGGVLCPFHADKKGSEFVRKVEATGNIFLYCSTCQRKYYMRTTFSPVINRSPNKKPKQTPRPVEEDRVYTADELLDLPFTKDYVDAENRQHVLKQLAKIEEEITWDKGYQFPSGDRQFKSRILYLPEGSGKSHLVINLAKQGGKIIFACKSWQQAEAKYHEYQRIGIQEGFNVRMVRSKDAKARRRFNTQVVRGKQRGPYDTARILDKESIEAFIQNNPDLSPEFIRLTWQFFMADRFSFDNIPHPEIDEKGKIRDDNLLAPLHDDNTRIIVSTFEQLRIHRLRNTHIPDEWMIWFDDPDITDVIDVERYDTERWEEIPDDKLEEKTREINGRRYFRRDYRQSLGYSLRNHKCIYTTTEIITKLAIEQLMKQRREQFVVHDKMDNIMGGTITILGTKMVRKRYDGIIPPIVRRLSKQKIPTLLIADGLASEINHSNNKGRNDLNKTNLLVELSIPHPVQVKTVCDALDLSSLENNNEIATTIMLDRMHQAIGRNSGYRWKGFQCVVLVDKKVHRKMVDETRYLIDFDNSVMIDRTQKMSRKERRTQKSASDIVQELENQLNNIDAYVADGRKIKPDLKFVIEKIKSDKDRSAYLIRLITSLAELSSINVKKLFTEYSHLNDTQLSYRDLIVWLLDSWVPEGKRETVLEKVYENMD